MTIATTTAQSVALPARLGRTCQMLRYVRPVQAGHRLVKIARGQVRRRAPGLCVARLDRLARHAPAWAASSAVLGPVLGEPTELEAQAARVLTGRVRLLAREGSLRPPVDWRPDAGDYLWVYNLHYFEYLEALRWWVQEKPSERETCRAAGAALIEDWINRHPYPHAPGWDPYPLSLRLVYWQRFLGAFPECRNDTIRISIYRQLRVLAANIEHDLVNNHILENLAGVLFGCACFESTPAITRLADEAAAEFDRELSRELTPSGVQNERSPMYQSLLLSRLLMLRPLKENGRAPIPELDRWIDLMAGGLQRFLLPDGSLAHFNDSADGVAPPPERLLNEARRIAAPPAVVASDENDTTQAGVILRLTTPDACCLVEAEGPQPAGNPAHAHAAMGCFVFCRGRTPIIVDPGCTTYEAGERRSYERSTAAHNTLCLGDQNQSDVWGRFRVGRRARVLWRQVVEEPTMPSMAVRHDGYRQVGYLHTRRLILVEGALIVVDRVDPSRRSAHPVSPAPPAEVAASMRLTLPIGAEVRREGDGHVIRIDGTDSAVRFGAGWLAEEIETPIGVEFGRAAATRGIIARSRVRAGWVGICVIGPPDLRVGFVGESELAIGDQRFRFDGINLDAAREPSRRADQ